jgi:hypothetical protein
VCRRVCGVLHGAYSARTTHRASIWSLSSFAIEACPPFHRPSHCLLRHSKLPVSLLLKHHSRSLQMRVSSVNSALPPVCIHVSHFITQTPPPLHAHHCRPPYISSSPMLFLFFVSRTASLLANRPSNKLIAAGLLVYIYIFSNTSVSSIFIIVHKLETASRTMQRRVTCSFLEPIPELRRSDSGKPYALEFVLEKGNGNLQARQFGCGVQELEGGGGYWRGAEVAAGDGGVGELNKRRCEKSISEHTTRWGGG